MRTVLFVSFFGASGFRVGSQGFRNPPGGPEGPPRCRGTMGDEDLRRKKKDEPRRARRRRRDEGSPADASPPRRRLCWATAWPWGWSSRPFSCSFLLRALRVSAVFFLRYPGKHAFQAISRRLKGPAAPLSQFHPGHKEGAQPTRNPEAPKYVQRIGTFV